MRILLLMGLSLLMPTICLAHSGSVLGAVTNYLPFLAPIAVGAAAIAHRWSHRIKGWFGKKKEK